MTVAKFKHGATNPLEELWLRTIGLWMVSRGSCRHGWRPRTRCRRHARADERPRAASNGPWVHVGIPQGITRRKASLMMSPSSHLTQRATAHRDAALSISIRSERFRAASLLKSSSGADSSGTMSATKSFGGAGTGEAATPPNARAQEAGGQTPPEHAWPPCGPPPPGDRLQLSAAADV